MIVISLLAGLIMIRNGANIVKTGGYSYWDVYVGYSGWQNIAGYIYIFIGTIIILYSIYRFIRTWNDNNL